VAYFRVSHDYRADRDGAVLVLLAGEVLDLEPRTAAWLLVDSPDVVVPLADQTTRPGVMRQINHPKGR